jgi:hypothetical protein
VEFPQDHQSHDHHMVLNRPPTTNTRHVVAANGGGGGVCTIVCERCEMRNETLTPVSVQPLLQATPPTHGGQRGPENTI